MIDIPPHETGEAFIPRAEKFDVNVVGRLDPKGLSTFKSVYRVPTA
jgi:hypothetical protein